MNWEILKPFLAGYARKALTVASIYLMTKGVLPKAEENEFVGAGMLFASVAWEGVHLYGHAALGALLKKITAAPMLAAAMAVAAKTAPGVGVIQSTVVPITKAIVLLAILIIGTLMVAAPGYAEIKKPAFTGHLAKDVQTDLNGGVPVTPAAPATDASGNLVCDIKLFLTSDPTQLLANIKACIAQDATKNWVPDFTAALASATAAKNQLGVNCLTPASAIVVAIAGTPEVPANPNATPPTAAVPGSTAGPVTLWEKVSEFAQAGGPSACKAFVNTTVQNLLTP